MQPHPSFPALQRLARLCGIKTGFWDIEGKYQVAAENSLLAALRALGFSIDTPDRAPELIDRIRTERWQRIAPPVVVAWDGRLTGLNLRLPADGPQSLRWRWQPESDQVTEHDTPLDDLQTLRSKLVHNHQYAVKRLPLPQPMPLGYHHVHLEYGDTRHQVLVIAAPVRAWQPEVIQHHHKGWGIFIPTYALHDERSFGAGDWGTLKRTIQWAHQSGAHIVATLPMLAGYLGETEPTAAAESIPQPFEPSPYSPASRLFLNEFYIDLDAVPELAQCDEAQTLLSSEPFQRSIEALRTQPLIDYRQQMQLKRRILEPLARHFFDQSPPDGPRRQAFDRFLQARPSVKDYAGFRAAVEARGPWTQWTAQLAAFPAETGPQSAPEATATQYHLYVQWIAHEQLSELARHASENGPGLYLDMPLGVNAAGYDVWRWPHLFARGAAGGAPPDDFFSGGQDWGFPPLHPGAIRDDRYRYVIHSLRELMRFAGILRIDHVMGLHRLYWIPAAMAATEGVYVNYPAQELYAILLLESHRNQTMLVGEDLGTVPHAIREALDRHAIHRMYLMQFCFHDHPHHAIGPAPAGSVASLNSHDTATFAGFWKGRDIDIRLELGLIDEGAAVQIHHHRDRIRHAVVSFLREKGLLDPAEASLEAIHEACLQFMAAGSASTVLVNLEDLWLEEQPQNVPGTWRERPNWRRRARQSFEQWSRNPDLERILQRLDQRCRHRGPLSHSHRT